MTRLVRQESNSIRESLPPKKTLSISNKLICKSVGLNSFIRKVDYQKNRTWDKLIFLCLKGIILLAALQLLIRHLADEWLRYIEKRPKRRG